MNCTDNKNAFSGANRPNYNHKPTSKNMPPTGNTTDRITATVAISTAGAAVYPPLSGLDLLTAREVVTADARSPLRLKWAVRPLFTPRRDLAGTPCATGPLPLAPLAAELVRAAGGQVRMPAPVPWAPAALDPQLCPDAGMIRAIAREPWLTVRYNPRCVDRLRLAVQIPLAFKDKTVAVVAKTEAQVDAFAAMAGNAGLEVTVFSGPRDRELPRPARRDGHLRHQVAVGTFAGLAHDDALLSRRDIVVVLDVLEGLEKRALRVIECARPGRLIGLLSDKAGVPPADLDRLMKVYGLAEVRVGAHGMTDRPVVYGSVVYKGTRLKPGLSPAKVKELGVWANVERNRRIADIVTALSSGNHRAIAKLLSQALRRKLPTRAERAGAGSRVAVVVENANHGNELFSMLPGCIGVGRGLQPVPAAGRSTPGWGEPAGANHDNVVCTFDGSKETRLGEFDVVIRADGGTGPLPLAADFGSENPTARELVFIDIDDRFHFELERNGRARMVGYRRLGWQRVIEPAGFDQLRRYLARHPRGDAIRAHLRDVKQSGNNSDTAIGGDTNDTPAPAAPIVYAWLPPSTPPLTLPAGRPRRLPPNGLSGYSRPRTRRRNKNAPLRVLEGHADYLPPFAEIVGTDNLYAVLHEMMNTGAGAGTGEDGIGLYDLSPREWATHLRKLSERVLDGGYRPEPAKLVEIPKPDGKFRPIEVGTVADRVLAGAVNSALSPHLDPQFLNNSYGFRPKLSHWDMLAAVKLYIEATGVTVAVVDDVRQAFPSVCHDPLLVDVAHLINGAKPANYDPAPLLKLIEAIVRGRDPRHHKQKGVGITQGCPLSPLFLNTHMHPRHDLVVDRERALIAFWARYADNLLYMVKNVTDGVKALGLVRQLLKEVGLDLKGTKTGPSTPTDLRVRPVELLGFSLQVREGKVVLDIPDEARKDLAGALQEAHRTDEPGKQAKYIVNGWTEACGPAVENRVETAHQTILDTVRENGFKGVITPEDLFDRLKDSRDRWKGTLERATRQRRGY